ncbi:MAG: N-acetylmuramoyl-L-alanine amidase [Bacteroidales bacterium]|nr:N-acetylmuramoyl-L-alanine amidase [Bacteroidales bacterium]
MLILLDSAHGHNTPGKRSPDGTLLEYAYTHCPAVLIENFFMDNKQDLAYLLSQEGRREIIETIIDGIERCVLTLVSG